MSVTVRKSSNIIKIGYSVGGHANSIMIQSFPCFPTATIMIYISKLEDGQFDCTAAIT